MCDVCDGKGRILTADEIVREYPEWGGLGWASRPADTGSKNIVVIEVTLSPGQGHNFHKHPRQEEILYMIQVKKIKNNGFKMQFNIDHLYHLMVL